MSYGRLFRIKVLLPVITIIMVVMFITLPMINNALESKMTKTAEQANILNQSTLNKVDKTVTLNNIVYEGKAQSENGDTVYKVTAQELSNSILENAPITLVKPKGTVATANGVITTFVANSGLYDRKTNVLSFTGDVQAESSQGTVLTSEKIMVDFKANTIQSIGATTIQRNNTILSGQGAFINNDNVFQMTGKTTLITKPNP